MFRRLFYTYTPDVAKEPFVQSIEVDTVEKTGGSISNLDLYVDAGGAAHLLYTRRPHQYEFLRDKYFPGEPMTCHLEHSVLKEGRIVSRSTLAQSPSGPTGLTPSFARFHAAPGDKLYVIVSGTLVEVGGKSTFGNWIAVLPADESPLDWKKLDLKHPFGSFFTNTPRGGSKPSEIIDLFGTTQEPQVLRYARVRLK